MIDKNKATIEFIQECPSFVNSTFFFNFGNIEEGAHQFITQSDDVSLHKPYIDGSVQKRYTMYIDTFKSVAYNPMINFNDENYEEFGEAEEVLQWINDQNDKHNYPDFGPDCIIDEMITLTTKPELLQVNTDVEPPVAIYRITIQIDYLDKSKKIY